MLDKVIEILRANRLAALATVGPDGWPHCTMVGFANEGARIYFAIAANSQKFADIQRDDRVSLAIGRDVIDPSSIHALAIRARASIVEESKERKDVIELLYEKRPALKRLEEPTRVMCAIPEEIRLLDYSKGYGHSVLIQLDPEGRVLHAEEQVHDWGYGNTFKEVD
jgi:general stress protein 26